jgi:hypothetical protein
MSLAVIDSSHQVIRFDPTKYRIRQAACDYGIAEAKRIRDWPALEEAVDAKNRGTDPIHRMVVCQCNGKSRW